MSKSLSDLLSASSIQFCICCSETLRKYPAIPFLLRRSDEEYTFDKYNVTIPKGIRVMVSIYGIHRDPKIYPDPDCFDPERFTEENIKQRHPSHYLPFGTGPRSCIGQKFHILLFKNTILTIFS